MDLQQNALSIFYKIENFSREVHRKFSCILSKGRYFKECENTKDKRMCTHRPHSLCSLLETSTIESK